MKLVALNGEAYDLNPEQVSLLTLAAGNLQEDLIGNATAEMLWFLEDTYDKLKQCLAHEPKNEPGGKSDGT